MANNPANKTRKSDAPYLTIENVRTGWTWKVLKFWQADGTKEYGRAFCAVSSPLMYGETETGDTYVNDLRTALRTGGRVTQSDLTDEQAATLIGIPLDALTYFSR